MPRLPLASLVEESPLIRTVTCPNCWHTFVPEGVQWIAVHEAAGDDPFLPQGIVGAQKLRFTPERFDVEGRALDSRGAPCTQLACPRCRLVVPRASLEMPNMVLSVLGAPGSGKSVFLTSMVFAMRQEAARFGVRFQDADLTMNKWLLEDEKNMFLEQGAETFRPFLEVVKKTALDDPRYRRSVIDGHEVNFVTPYAFLLTPAAGHPRVAEAARLSRLLCLYDNAGEHFLPGTDAADRPMTRHLAASKGLMFIFDPTKDRRVRRKLGEMSDDASSRQDIVLMEAANRIREHAGIAQTATISQQLVVVLTKFDAWRSLLPDVRGTSYFRAHPSTPQIEGLQWDEVEAVSNACKEFLRSTCREVVTAIESVSDNVLYAPVAAVGWDVRRDTRSGLPSFMPLNTEPQGVLVPLVSLLAKMAPKVVLSMRR